MTVTDTYRGAVSADPDTAKGPLPEADQAKVPYAMRDFDFVPKERYYDRAFYELEKKQLWPRVWQMAARLEEIPLPGDFVEYEIAGNSILLIRQRDGGVKALHNACRHRATELVKGKGRLPGGQLVCPFHGWRWNLDGSPSLVFGRDSFNPCTLKQEDIRLVECKVEIWAGMVWINMDPAARPLAEYLAPVQELLDGVGVGNMRVKWWKQVVLNANWKMTQEAFFEGYHVMQTHPQLLMGGGEEVGDTMNRRIEYSVFRGGHARFQSGADAGRAYLESGPESHPDFDSDSGAGRPAAGEVFLESGRLLAAGQDAMTLDRDVQIFEGLRNKIGVDAPDFPQQAIAALYEYAAGAGIPMAPPSAKTRLWGGDIYMFANYLMLPMYGNCLAYRSRPYNDDPESVLFDIWSLTTYPEGQEPERAELKGRFDKGDVDNWGLIPRQDFSNIERQQRGLHSVSYQASRLSAVYEKSIANMHQELDRYLLAGGH
jgi:phenylpropionate dioxygenase-like ring-hydroxylating dioxygenase large terminal subunit